MTFDWVTFAFQLVNVLVLLAILRRFLFRPVADIIAKRRAETEAALAQAEAAQSQAKVAIAAAKAEADANAAARRDIIANAHIEAEAEGQRLVEAARAEAAAVLAAARDTSEQLASEADAAALDRAGQLASVIAERALSAQPQPPVEDEYARRLAEALAAMSDQGRRMLLSGGNLRLLTARPISQDELGRIRAVLTPFGLSEVCSETDPSLILGLELRSESGFLHNSLRHDLSRIAEALRNGDGSRI